MSINQIFNIINISNKIQNISINATNEELETLTSFLEILKVVNLSFNGKLYKENNYIFFQGVIKSNIIQECSVSLDPINVSLEIKINKKYQILPKNKNSKKELIFSLNDDDEDILDNNSIILKQIIEEEMILNIDPYIKKFHLID